MNGFNCKINRNISLNVLNEDGSSTNCNSQDISMGVGGLRSPIYIYNIDEIDGLKFENDNRADDTLIVDEIITSNAFYSIDFTSASYNEQFDGNKYTHTLTLNINNISPLFEDLLSESTNGRYLVCFKPNGDIDYRMFGWKGGASLNYSMNLDEDNMGYTVEFTDNSNFPLMSVYSDNFNVRNKVFNPLFKVLYEVSYCEVSAGVRNGYAVAMYVVKVNSSGQALDEDNKLCQWSGKKQDAYKWEAIATDGNYNIIGTYNTYASFDGKPVRVQDFDLCPTDVEGSITINGEQIYYTKLNSTTTSKTVRISSTDSWQLLSNTRYTTVTPTNGTDGNTNVTVYHNGSGGVDILQFQNRRTKERVTLSVEINLIKIDSEYTFQNGTAQFILTPTVEGSNPDYTYTVTPTLSVVKDANGNLICTPTVSDEQQEFTFVLTHRSDVTEVKTVHVTILGNNRNPAWRTLSSFCEVE